MNRSHSLLQFPERLASSRQWLPYALLLSVTLFLYAPALYFNFVWDDVAYIHKNYRVQGLSWAHLQAFWTHTYLGHYAPVHHTFLALLHHFSGLAPFGYHLGQVLLHASCVCLLYFALNKMEAPRVALLASLLFAVHPTNIETVAWISETKSTLAFLFFLLSFCFFLRLRERERWLDGVLCAVFLILSILSKINTIVAPAIFLLYDYKQGSSFKARKLGSLASLFLISLIFAGVHLWAFHHSPQAMENAYYGGLGVHLMNLPLLLAFYMRMIVFPYPLSAWEMFPVQTQFHWVVALGWAGMIAAAALLLYRTSRAVQFWALWIVVFLLPVLQIIPFPIWVADRYLYVPAIGGFVLASQFFWRIWDRLVIQPSSRNAPGGKPWRRRAWGCAMTGTVLVLAWRTQSHLPVWRDDLTLWEATVPTCETSSYCHLSFGWALLRDGQTERAMKELIRAVEIRPSFRSLRQLGDAYAFAVGDYRQAVLAYTMAMDGAGDEFAPELYGKLARVHMLQGDLVEARNAIEAGKKIDPTEPRLLVMEGFLEWKLGHWQEARRLLRRALDTAGAASNPAAFLLDAWGNAADVRQLLSDTRFSQGGSQ